MAVYVCGDCLYADLDNTNWRGYVKCSKLGVFVDPNSNSCYRSSERPSSSSSHCYITTMVCDILGYEDDCKYLNVLRDFRDNYMKKDVGCLPLLLEYDMVGPAICYNLKKSPIKGEIAKNVFENYITPAVCSIEAQDYDQAIEIYMNMTNRLEHFFGVSPFSIDVDNFDYNSIDLNGLGKARVRI